MKVLVAAVGDRADDFAFTIPGEVVTMSPSCVAEIRTGECGCSRAWAGVASNRATSVAEVAELDTSVGVLGASIRTGVEAEGWPIGDEELADLILLARAFPVGTRLRRDHDLLEPE